MEAPLFVFQDISVAFWEWILTQGTRLEVCLHVKLLLEAIKLILQLALVKAWPWFKEVQTSWHKPRVAEEGSWGLSSSVLPSWGSVSVQLYRLLITLSDFSFKNIPVLETGKKQLEHLIHATKLWPPICHMGNA